MASKELEQDRLAPQFDATKAATSHAQVMKLSQGVGGVSDLGCHSWSLEQAADHIISDPPACTVRLTYRRILGALLGLLSFSQDFIAREEHARCRTTTKLNYPRSSIHNA